MSDENKQRIFQGMGHDILKDFVRQCAEYLQRQKEWPCRIGLTGYSVVVRYEKLFVEMLAQHGYKGAVRPWIANEIVCGTIITVEEPERSITEEQHEELEAPLFG